MVAPGRAKGDFAITLDKNLLTISYQKQEEVKDETKKQVRREFKLESFKRSFTLSEQTDATKITAVYENGILYVSIPKKEIVKVEPTIIEIK
jgi:HSP20 family protein